MTPHIAVIGIGNVLLGDDGLGPFVIELLRARWEFPENVVLIDAGTPSLDLIGHLQGHDAAILIDTVAAAGQAGEVRTYSGDALRSMPLSPRLSPHDPAVQEALCIADLAGTAPLDVLLVGVIPDSTEMGPGMTPPVYAAALEAASIVVQEVAQRGGAPQLRHPREPFRPWWLQTASVAR